MIFENTKEHAQALDRSDPLAGFRARFNLPEPPTIYFCGNSLGLQPASARSHIEREIERWHKIGVEGWFDETDPWLTYQDTLSGPMAKIVGAQKEEVVVMNSLTVNLHLLMTSFYRPIKERFKILLESDAFPSDRYALRAQVEHHGFDPAEALVVVEPDNEDIISTQKMLETIESLGDSVAMVLLGGVNYYTGQLFDIKSITKAARARGAFVGWDLAHAARNVPLNLHDDNVDFAAWCNYKYLNSGPGAIASAFVHSRHHSDRSLHRLAGWWGQSISSRFNMRKDWDPEPGANGWMVSTPNIIGLSAVRASLEIFKEAGMAAIREKSIRMTSYLEYLLSQNGSDRIEIITPKEPRDRGAQLSIRVKGADRGLFDQISHRGVIADWREPDVIRVAPAPLYNTYSEVWEFSRILEELI